MNAGLSLTSSFDLLFLLLISLVSNVQIEPYLQGGETFSAELRVIYLLA